MRPDIDRTRPHDGRHRVVRYLPLIVAHLNTSTGPVLTAERMERTLRTGTLLGLPTDPPEADALLASLFVEVEPRLIVLAARESGVSEAQLDALYRETLAWGAPRVPGWESVSGRFE